MLSQFKHVFRFQCLKCYVSVVNIVRLYVLARILVSYLVAYLILVSYLVAYLVSFTFRYEPKTEAWAVFLL